MTTLIFLLAVATVAGTVLAAETRADGPNPSRTAVGLLDWLSSGNWPAKIGAGLLVIGVGALIRFALQNLEVPDTMKFGSGLATSGLLALVSTLVGTGPQRRAVALALGGAAFGVAYLTAYSAFALFGYVDSETGTALLLLTAVGASAYAVTRSALSLAVLAMFGAFLAPAFAITDPGPTIVYGYYIVASLVTLAMVAIRGWRPLIHLSFVFTLAGGTLFAWTSKYYTDTFADVMQPALLLLAAIHVAMPIAERRGESRVWVQRLDLAYTLGLPVATAVAAAFLADSSDRLTITLAGLGAIWLIAAGLLRLIRSEGAGAHLVIGALLLGFAAAARFRDLPWELLALGFTVIALWMASRWSDSRRLETILAGLVPITGAIHILSALAPAATTLPFFNERFAERAIGAALLMFAGHVCRRARNSLDTLLWSVGVGWAVIAIGLELLRADLVTVAIVLHWATIVATVAIAFAATQRRTYASWVVFLPLAVVFTASWANDTTPLAIAWASLFAATAALSWLGISERDPEAESRTAAIASITLAPIVAAIWAEQAIGLLAGDRLHAAVAAGAAIALLLLVVGRLAQERATLWRDTVSEIFAIAFAATLLLSTTLDIGREIPAIVLELLCLAGLLFVALVSSMRAPPSWALPAAAVGAILWLQATLLRVLGPPGDLSLLSIDAVSIPAAISLLWAVSGAALTLAGHRRRSRSLWAGGAVMLVGATVKIVLFDIGSLGELGNILAVIAAGLVFLAVGWIAPMPPAANPPPRSTRATAATATSAVPATPADRARAEPAPRTQPEPPRPAAPEDDAETPARVTQTASGDYWQHTASRKKATRSPEERHSDATPNRAWTITLIVIALLLVTRFSEDVLTWIGLTALRVIEPPRTSMPAPQPPPQQPAEAPRPQQTAPITAAVPTQTECQRWRAQLPTEYELLAGGARRGKPLGFVLDGQTDEAGAFDVLVNQPGRDVVLLLGSYEPSVWTIRWTSGTRIAGVWISGIDRPEVTGLAPGTPLLRTYKTPSSAGGCPNFTVASNDTRMLADASQQVLGRPPARANIADAEGLIAFGEANSTTGAEHGPTQPPASFRDTSQPLTGDAGLQELIDQRLLRRATSSDVRRWTAFARSQGRQSMEDYMMTINGEPRRVFVVLGPMKFPGGLFGAHSAMFIVPPGMDRPRGEPGHSTILDMN